MEHRSSTENKQMISQGMPVVLIEWQDSGGGPENSMKFQSDYGQ